MGVLTYLAADAAAVDYCALAGIKNGPAQPKHIMVSHARNFWNRSPQPSISPCKNPPNGGFFSELRIRAGFYRVCPRFTILAAEQGVTFLATILCAHTFVAVQRVPFKCGRDCFLVIPLIQLF